MRSAFIAAAFAAGALAVPHEKRAVVTDVDTAVVYETDVVTVTAGAGDPAPAETTTTAKGQLHWGHKSHHWSWASQWTSTTEAATTEAPSPTSTTEAAPSSTEETSAWSSKTKTKTQPTTTAAATNTGSGSTPTDYSEIAVYHHNLHRSNHSAPDVKWSAKLAKSAADIAATCVYAHNVEMDGGGYGQNIAAGVEGNNVSAVITDLFYNGEVGWYTGLYGEAQPDMTNFEHWGHFSQIVWKSTTHIGCATQDCTGQGLANVGSDVSPYFTVCNYGPPGNYANEYGDNVLSPLGHATAEWNTGL